MSTLPPQPARRAYTQPETSLLGDEDYGTADLFSTPAVPATTGPIINLQRPVITGTPSYESYDDGKDDEVDEVEETEETEDHPPADPGVIALLPQNVLPPQVDVLVGNIVDRYSEQGKKDGLISLGLSGFGFMSLITGFFGVWLLALPIVLAIMGLVWSRKAKKNGTPATAGLVLGWATIGVSVAGLALFGLLAGTAYMFFK